CDFKVTTETYKGASIATAVRGDTKFHSTLLGDTLAIATSIDLLKRSVDAYVAKGAGSLARTPRFAADMKAMPPSAALVEWIDLERLDAQRASLESGLAALGAPPDAIGAVRGVLDGTKGGGSLAIGAYIPSGDLYQVKWAWSKGPELFADRTK